MDDYWKNNDVNQSVFRWKNFAVHGYNEDIIINTSFAARIGKTKSAIDDRK